MKFATRNVKILTAAIALSCIAAIPASAQQYDFLSPPNPDTNRLYRVNTKTGEMGMCWHHKDKHIGYTECFKVGEGAGPQKNGRYKLYTTNFPAEKAVFRVNTNTGAMSLCWLRRGELVCTEQAR